MSNESVRAHYAIDSLSDRIEQALTAAFGDTAIDAGALGPLDEFHIGGREATQHVLDAMSLTPDRRVVDLGAGIGGGARFAASHYGCDVSGVDLTPEYCDIANSLSSRVGLGDQVRITASDACATPYDASAFDAAYTMHVAMNIADKPALYREAARILRPGAVFAIYDVMQGTNTDPLAFPLPWASTQNDSFLAAPGQVEAALEDAGFTVESREDRTAYALQFFEKLRANAAKGPPPLGLHIVMGDSFKTKIGNLVQNISEGKCAPWLIVARLGA